MASFCKDLSLVLLSSSFRIGALRTWWRKKVGIKTSPWDERQPPGAHRGPTSKGLLVSSLNWAAARHS